MGDNPFDSDDGEANPFSSPPNPFAEPPNPFSEDTAGEKADLNPFGEPEDEGARPPGPLAPQARPRALQGAQGAVAALGGQERPRKKAAAPQPPSGPRAPPGPPATPGKLRGAGGLAGGLARTLIPVEESTAQHHELFLQEIEAVDEYWGPTFRCGGLLLLLLPLPLHLSLSLQLPPYRIHDVLRTFLCKNE